MKPEKLPFRC